VPRLGRFVDAALRKYVHAQSLVHDMIDLDAAGRSHWDRLVVKVGMQTIIIIVIIHRRRGEHHHHQCHPHQSLNLDMIACICKKRNEAPGCVRVHQLISAILGI
jgi:hypothetical protein